MRIVSERRLAAAPSDHGAAQSAEHRASSLGDLPEWDLTDLYPDMAAPELQRDLQKAAADAAAFETRWKGTLAVEAGREAAGRLGEALQAYEALEELIGRIVSYAGLVYAGDTSDPRRAKLYGDIQEKMTDASAHLLFFALELNLIDDAVLEKALDADPAFGHYRPWVLDLRKDKPLPARRPHRAAVPREVDHRARRLEPPVRRDHDRSALRRRRRGTDAGTDAEPAAGRRRRGPPAGSRGAGRNLSATTCASSR